MDEDTGEVVNELPAWTAIDYILYVLRRVFRTDDGALNGTFYICLYVMIGTVLVSGLVLLARLLFCGEKSHEYRGGMRRGRRIAVKNDEVEEYVD